MSVSVYYKKLHALRQELDHHEPLISCTCCSDCTVGHLHEVRREQSKLHDFLIGLYFEYYSSLWTNILSQDPLPSHDRAYHLVLQEERIRTAKHESETTLIEALGFAVRVTAGRGRGSANRPVCSHCKKIGHVTEKYWSFLVCSHCKKHSHDVSKFYDIIGYPKGWTEKSGRLSFAGQGRGLLHAIATPGSTSTSSSMTNCFDVSSWIIDTGATHHVIGEKSWLFDVHTVDCPVGLRNGEKVLASLEDPLKKLIKTEVRRDGLCYFSKLNVVQHVSTVMAVSALELWHR
ncbi:uncharacterized protein LOC129890698 [Solanum dulcamara]|uniref:uncharacterized protein LOC129890698 n=1 Tax=Solanum dulcamara TaxID=45834 RepID=UPI0024858C6C|nr:uncharacterized protein LOC129890698 [Solanum dulcamara]